MIEYKVRRCLVFVLGCQLLSTIGTLALEAVGPQAARDNLRIQVCCNKAKTKRIVSQLHTNVSRITLDPLPRSLTLTPGS